MPDIISRLRRQLRDILSTWKHAIPCGVERVLQASLAKRVQVPHFYLLPKVHKMMTEVTRYFLHDVALSLKSPVGFKGFAGFRV